MPNQLLIEQISNSLNSIRPYLKDDGGDVEIVDVTEDFIVKVKLLGACSSCIQSEMTMKAGIETTIKQAFPQVKAVEAV